MPGADAALLFALAHEQQVGGRVATDKSLALQRVEFCAEACEILRRLLRRGTLGGEVFLLVLGVRLAAEQVFGVGGQRSIEAQVVHVGIELRSLHQKSTYAHCRGDAYCPQQWSALVEAMVADFLRPCKWLSLAFLPLAEQWRQQGEAEQRGAHDGEGGEESEVLQQWRVDEDKSHERAHGGDAAQRDGRHLFAQHLLGVLGIALMRENMEHIAKCHAKHNGANTEGEQRELPFDELHHRQSHQCAEKHRQNKQDQRATAAEAQKKEKKNHEKRAADGGHEVMLYL